MFTAQYLKTYVKCAYATFVTSEKLVVSLLFHCQTSYSLIEPERGSQIWN